MIRWPSPAKLNLFLYITGRRPNSSYHNLQTLFQFLDYCDYLTFQVREDTEINLLTPIKNVPDQSNLIVIAAKLLRLYALENKIHTDKPMGVDISIEKILPMGGGIGGASSNAATVLVAMNKLWDLNLSTEQLMDLGRKIGADVAIFIYGHCAFAEGVGDQFQPVHVAEKWYIVARPDVEISTAKVFGEPDLKRDSVTKNITELLNSPFSNDCEPVVRQQYPEVDRVIRTLSKHSLARLTGTGSCVFAEFESEAKARQVQQCLPDDIESFVAKGVNYSPLLNFSA
ncbi:4-(cytidine 5'-diphospho)-2-C-methyl-D-erythritol kinase [Zophobihabitans entericus]|uniref:4-diphosphocytidyl-2-C-methyl-D-erythritol kinase n=1 Tax=Zophobihabitans entericus TaxID=1635327 RepID=A0A6G9IE70_9GAMM|nr:4-(cytidine 5'-diphospho)-2-C-methyl-D-erythritol kinase [Zophobihabitans entericus]QIQ22109.1 4-(cytidine 5'-diphospho)-2-C-methyl-D-erythritol kinase [Zophobihabitans entericus]